MFEPRFKHFFSSTTDLAFVPIPNTFPETAPRGRLRKSLGERSPKGGFNGAKVPQCLGIREDKCHQAERTRGRRKFFPEPIPRDGFRKVDPFLPMLHPGTMAKSLRGSYHGERMGPGIHPFKKERFSDLSQMFGFQRSSYLPSLPFPRKGSE
jgi:hypothetical protein